MRRRARVLTAEDPTILEIKDGPYETDLEAESRVASLQSIQVQSRTCPES